MSKIERILCAGSTEAPDCMCGREMALICTQELDGQAGTRLRIFQCSGCGHELRLTVWAEGESDAASRSGAVLG